MSNNNSLDEMIPDMRGVRETAEHFGIARHFVRKLALSGKVKACRAGNKILINQQSVADYFENSTLKELVPSKQDVQPISVRLVK